MQAVIIAAGRGSRIARRCDSKPLLPLAGQPLVERIMLTAGRCGIDEFVVVTGYNADKLRAHVQAFSTARGIAVRFVQNDAWERENGLSVLAVKGHVAERFVLLMSDHIFAAPILRRLLQQTIRSDETMLAVDRRLTGNPWIDMDDVTRVHTAADRILAIGKGLTEYNAFDIGMFLCSPGLFAALEESGSAGDFTLSGGMRRLARNGRALVMDIGDHPWIDVDDEAALAKAEAHLSVFLE